MLRLIEFPNYQPRPMEAKSETTSVEIKVTDVELGNPTKKPDPCYNDTTGDMQHTDCAL